MEIFFNNCKHALLNPFWFTLSLLMNKDDKEFQSDMSRLVKMSNASYFDIPYRFVPAGIQSRTSWTRTTSRISRF